MGKGTKEVAEFPENTKLLLICINQTYAKWGADIAVRYSWKINPTKAAQAELVLAVCHGVIEGVFEAKEWLAATKENFSGDIPPEQGNWDKQEDRFGFRGSEAPSNIKGIYFRKGVPKKWGFKGNPIRYVNF
jgi:hypothetical protein